LLADSFKYTPRLMIPILEKLMVWLLKTLEQDDEGLARNVVYTFGVMAAKNPSAV